MIRETVTSFRSILKNENKTSFMSENENIFKVPPNSIEAEQSVLGGVMLDDSSIDTVVDMLKPSDFYTESHQRIFNNVLVQYRRNQPVDLVTLVAAMQEKGELDDGEKAYLAELVKNTPGTSNIEYYARLVKEKSVLRGLIRAGNDIASLGFHPAGNALSDITDQAEKALYSVLTTDAARSSFAQMDDMLDATLQNLDKLFNSGESITGLATGFSEFDELTSGLQDGDLIILAGRPSMGKTALSLEVSLEAFTNQNMPTAFFSMEMPDEQLIKRIVASIGDIDLQKMRNGQLEQDDFVRLNKAYSLLKGAPFHVDDTPALTIAELRSRARRLDREVRRKQLQNDQPETGLGLIVVDYLQLMRGSDNTENRTLEVSELSRGLKALARELNLPLIALSQLNRSVEQRPDKRPRMSDLRDSGAIEQDADLIAFIYRDEVYNPETDSPGVAELILEKQRNGPKGTVMLRFDGEKTKFADLKSIHSEY